MAKIVIENKKLNNLIRQRVVEVIQDVLTDPYFGLEIQEKIKKRLRKKPKKFIPFEQIKKIIGKFYAKVEDSFYPGISKRFR